MITLLNSFITEEEEQSLLSHIKPSRVTSGKERNNIMRYGSSRPYNAPILGPIPPWLSPLIKRVSPIAGFVPDSVTINEYHKGQAIDWHIDSPSSGPIITVLSLLSPAKMGMKGETEDSLTLPRRSLLILTEDDRWKKKHCIFPVEGNRFSIVFRKGT